MRDPNRIWGVMTQMSIMWHEKCPDWRFMQLMSNFITWLGCDPFYMEDNEFCDKFHEFMETL